MTIVKITELPAATTPLSYTEVMPIVQNNVTKQVALNDLFPGPSGLNASTVVYDPAGTGAVQTNVQAKLRQTISDADYGNLLQAIDAAGTNETVHIVGTPTQIASTNWKGRPHQTDEAPFLLNSFTWANANLNARMCVANDILYVAEYSNNKVAMFSLKNPRAPQYLGNFSTGSQPRHVDVIGRYVFVCCHGAASIQVYDAAQPGIAVLIGTITTGANPKMFQILGNEIYVANYSGTVQKFTFTLPVSGTTGFSSNLEVTANAPIGPLCLAVNGEGLLLVCGLDSPNVILMGSTNLNVIASVAVGGGQHGTISFVGSQQFLVTDSSLDRLYSGNVNSLGINVTGFADASPNPEQIEIVGNRCYVPSLTNSGEAAFLDCFDITDAGNPVRYKSVPLTSTGAGFTAYYTDGQTGYVYVNGHFSPYNIDVVEVASGPSGRLSQNASEYLQARFAGFSSAQVGQLTMRYRSILTSTSSNTADGVIRMGTGSALALHDPSARPGQLLIIENVTTGGVLAITNAFSGGFSGRTLFPGESVVLCAQDYVGSFQWDVVASNISRTHATYRTETSNTTATINDDIIRVGAGADVALPDPATMLGKVITIKNASASVSSDVTNAFTGYSGTLAAGEAVTVVASEFSTVAQWDAISSF